jgi:hypothetical protein
VLNSRFIANRAVGHGANPARAGTTGGGSGGALYMDGDTYTVSVAGTLVEGNHADEGGGAIFFVSNDRTGAMSVYWSTLRHTDGLPGIFFLGAHRPRIRHSVLR